MTDDSTLLSVKNLVTAFDTDAGRVTAVDGISFDLQAGKTLGIVGESGCGKSVTAMSIMRLLPRPAGQILGGSICFQGEDLVIVSDERMRSIRGKEIGVIFQEPMTALNPVHRIGQQLSETLLLHEGMSKKEAWNRSIEILELVGILIMSGCRVRRIYMKQLAIACLVYYISHILYYVFYGRCYI